MWVPTDEYQTSNPVSTKGWPNKRNLKENPFKIDNHSSLRQEMHLKSLISVQILNTCGVQLSLILLSTITLKRNLNIIFVDGFAVILSALALPVFYK